jgi:hypothetical protein
VAVSFIGGGNRRTQRKPPTEVRTGHGIAIVGNVDDIISFY